MADNTRTQMSMLAFFKYFERIVGWRMYIYFVLNFIVGLLDGIGLTMFIPLLYLATGSQKQETNSTDLITSFLEKYDIDLTLESALIFMVLVFIFKGVFSYIRTITFVNIQQKSIRKIRFRLIDSLRKLSYSGFTKLDAGIIQNNMTTETARLVQALTLYFNTTQSIVMLLTYLGLAFITNWQFSIMVCIGGIISNFIYKYLNKITSKHAKELSSIGRNFQAYLIQSIHNFKYLKATNYFKSYEKKLKKEIIDSEYTQFKLGKIAAISDNLREPLIIIIIAIVTLIQINYFESNKATIFAALLLFYRSLGYLANMQSYWNRFLANAPGLESVETILSNFEEWSEKETGDTINNIDSIQLRKISLNYGKEKVLKDINIHISTKSSIALVGESGAGKTTLANVICGLIPPSQGDVYYGNQNKLEKISLNSLRKKVGYITQEPVIFDDTIFNNITFWAEKTDENLKKFRNTIRQVSLEEFIENLEYQEDSPLGNNGVLVSGGQKQRISIARELYKNIDLLIMDEATSALDSETEKYIKENIDLLHGQFTMIIIAHRLSTIKNVDHIFMMENGTITHEGSFEELVRKSPKFKQMVTLQGMNNQ